jgi:LacI family transcriptional regulator/LacI family repressor for deo operon, udp, cdd, tsx, nupC, and nupG
MEPNPPRITHRHIAKVVGVHRATVSLALKNHPSIGPETRERIKAVAEELGYRPDPMLSALAAYRHLSTEPVFKGVIAWLAQSTHAYRWNEIPIFQSYYDGARNAAQRYGYQMEVFELSDLKMTTKRLASVLRARSINGLLLAPQPQAGVELDFPWEHFSAVTFGYTLLRPQLHLVSSTQQRAIVATLRELRNRGYRRIGFAYEPTHDERVDHNYIAGYLLDWHMAHSEILMAPATDYADPRGKFHSWIRQHKIEAIVTGNYNIVAPLAEAGISVPQDLGVACPSLPRGDLGVAGILEDAETIGKIAVEFLIASMQRGERGIPAAAQRILLEGHWVEGQTLRRTAPGPRRRK